MVNTLLYIIQYLKVNQLNVDIVIECGLENDKNIINIIAKAIKSILIVTASKKEQNVQDIAMSVQAITSAELEKKNIKTIDLNSVKFINRWNKEGFIKSRISYILTSFLLIKYVSLKMLRTIDCCRR